jgi:replication-associated recombination protein RarA
MDRLYTKRGYDFYEVASALQKSIRRGDINTAGYFALELFPEYANYAWKRLLTISAEDCYGVITHEVEALQRAFEFVNKGKTRDKIGGRIFISKAVILLCSIKHNRDADILSNYVYDKKMFVSDDVIEQYFDDVRKNPIQVPEYTYDVHTKQGRMMGKTKADFFRDEQAGLANQTVSLFDTDALFQKK